MLELRERIIVILLRLFRSSLKSFKGINPKDSGTGLLLEKVRNFNTEPAKFVQKYDPTYVRVTRA